VTGCWWQLSAVRQREGVYVTDAASFAGLRRCKARLQEMALRHLVECSTLSLCCVCMHSNVQQHRCCDGNVSMRWPYMFLYS
jgi:hypothetical protein